MATAFKIHHAIHAARRNKLDEQDTRWCAQLQHLVRAGSAISPELEETMSASGFDLERLHRCLLSARRRAPSRDL